MMISFRTKLFDTRSPIQDGEFHGRDVAEWLSKGLAGWRVEVVPEDWGWAVIALKEPYSYVFGVYDHDINDVTEHGAQWVLRLYNQRDGTPWFKKLFKYVPPVAHSEVTEEILQILSRLDGVTGISTAPL